ncbi:hypothetical protein D9611_011945 [Ephemerocybe angulata]|uniref:Uncharacterized protein n=1 Tax=Ephemerocybe angulata TaxID=980116 RepID=A0A8H5C5U9_9AGAR|nr:hypothetical protein D9611_011945 [Tulosesus angulatus]
MSSKGEKRPTPKRLFSFDTLKSSSSKRSSSEGHGTTSHGRTLSRGTNLTDVREGEPGSILDDGGFTSPPMPPYQDPFASRPGSPGMTRFELPRTGSPAPDSVRSGSPAPIKRWDTLRNHVLPSSRPSTPPSVPSHAHSHSSRPSVSSSSRPSTPKPSRFPRLAFRQVVDHAKEAHDTRKLAEEILRTCQAIRYPADSHHPKGKSDSAHSTVGGGSSMYIPFMSTSTLNNGGSNINATGASKKSEGRRQSQTSQMTGGSSAKGAVSVKTLHSIMFYHAAPPSDSVAAPVYLPHENHVLSTLLTPFQMPSMSGKWEEERAYAVEAFDLLIKGWLPKDEAASAERCIWCCKAALTPASPNRSRILSLLRRLLVPGERSRLSVSPSVFQTITHGLFVLQAFLHSPQAGPLFATELDLSKDLIEQFLSGSYGDIDETLLEEEYGVIRLPEDTRGSLRKAVFLEALARCLENCALSSRAWLLLNVVEDYWPLLGQDQAAYSPLQTAVHSRKLNTFCRAAYSLLQSHDLKAGEKHAVAQQIVALLETRLIPENALLDQTHALETGASIVRVVVECLVSDDARDATRWAVTTICRWLHHEDPRWKRNMDKHLQKMIAGQPWPNVFKFFSSALQHIPDADRKVVISIALPHLNDRMLNDPPPDKTPELGNLLNTISRLYPPIFFKPLFLCAVSAKEFTVVNHLCTIVTYSRYVEDFWVRDPEMLSMALLSDTGGSKESVMWSSANVPWTAARLGQSVLMVEFINQLQTMRRLKEAGSYTDSAFASIGKFIVALESRLSILIETREKKALIAPSQRMLLCMIFREFRLLTRSMKPAPWLQRTINWFTEFYVEDDFAGDLEQEVHEAMERIHGMYAAAQSGAKHSEQQRRSTMILSSSSQRKQSSHSATPSDILDLCAMFEKRKPLIDGLLKGFPSKALKLLVVVSPMLHEGDYLRIAPILWENGLADTGDASTTASACFLVMQCAEKTSMDTLAMIEVNLRSSDDRTRLEAVRKIGILVNWRFQIMTQNVLADRSHRPFKMARIPLPFVPTDMGTTLYIPSEDANESGEKSDVPTELKKQLAELGWVEHDSGPIDPQQIWIKTPMSLFPISQLDRMDVTTSLNPLDVGLGQGGQSPLPSPQPSPRRGARGRQESAEEAHAGVLRRNSTSGGPVASQKRRAIFVPPLANVFIRLTTLLHDPNFVIASTTRSILLDLMRNDPSLLSRPVMDILAGEHKDIELAISTLSNLLDVHQALPPPMSHTIFNHLMGFLKWSARQYDMPETLRDYALTLAMLSSVTTQVSGMSFREIRRSKTDAFVIPSGALWFPTSAPRGPMFPRGTEDFADPFEDITGKVISLTVVRISQNLLFLALLKRNGQEVNMIRKSMTRFVLPSLSPETVEPRALELTELLPGKQEYMLQPDSTIETLSMVLARSHLMLLAQIFRAMSRHLSDRNELATMIDGVNRILCVHGHDIGIVGHSLIALMVATTRFRRLFTSRTAYTLFVPALIKVYTESAEHPGIRPAIEYAFNRFYALHKDSFLYQSLGVVGQMAMYPTIDEKVLAESVYTLFFSLTKAVIAGVDAAGIHNVNKGQEREALIVNTAEEKPQTFLAAIKRADSATSQLTVLFPEEYEVDRLRMDNFIRLFLTVIAHDLSIIRAQHYLRLLRLLAPQLHNSSSSARTVLLEGISALGAIMVKGAPKSRAPDPTYGKASDGSGAFSSTAENHSADQSRIPSDLKAMRMDYLRLILGLGQAGGELSLKTARQGLDIVKLILKDSSSLPTSVGISSTSIPNAEVDNQAMSTYISDFVRMLLIRDQPPLVKAVNIFLQDLAPILHAHMITLDFSGVFETIYELVTMPNYATEASFSQVVIGEICTAGLAGCELAASENQFHVVLSLPFRTAFIKLLAECVFVQGADVVAEIEKRSPTYLFLAGVVFPLVLELKTDVQLNADGLRTTARHRTVLSSAWLRLLFYAMNACQRSLLSGRGKDGGGGAGGLLTVAGSIQRSRSRDKTNDEQGGTGGGSRRGRGRAVNAHMRAQVPVFVMGLQIVKAIVVRAELDISTTILGIWERIASFLKAMISEGNADFATRGSIVGGWRSAMTSQVASPAVSPTTSPRASFLNPASANASASNLFVQSPSSPTFRLSAFAGADIGEPGAILRRPRVLDYMLWSTLEFLWAYRSPLRIQLRLLTTEKIVALDLQLRMKGVSGGSIRTPMSSHPPSPRSRRVSSVFVKSRGERGHRTPPGVSPEVSPLLLPTTNPSFSGSAHLTPLSLDPRSTPSSRFHSPANSPFLDVQQPATPMNQRRPGYQISPSPFSRPIGAPRIVHLGPTSPSALQNQPYPISPSGVLLSNSNSGGGSRVSTLGAGLRAGLGAISAGGGKKKDRDSSRGRGGSDRRAGEVTVTGSDLLRMTKIKSIKLVEGTYRRIRGVQALMGYELLLPLPSHGSGRRDDQDGMEGDDEDEMDMVKTWTRSQALAAIGQETKDLLDEFEYWMRAAETQDLDADANADSDEEPLGEDGAAPSPNIQVDDFGVITSPGGPRSSSSGMYGPGSASMTADRTTQLLHPNSYVPGGRQMLGRSWQSNVEGSEEGDFNDRSSIVIEVDSTFVAESPNPSPTPSPSQRRQLRVIRL